MSPLRKGALALALSGLFAVATSAGAHPVPAEAANKQLVLEFYRALDEADAAGTTRERIRGIAERFISPDYVQHAAGLADLPGPGSARDKLIAMFEAMPAMKGMPPARTVAVMAEGDRVMLLTARDLPGPDGRPRPTYIFNMFRIAHGQLVEHWDVGTPMPPAGGGAPAPAQP